MDKNKIHGNHFVTVKEFQEEFNSLKKLIIWLFIILFIPLIINTFYFVKWETCRAKSDLLSFMSDNMTNSVVMHERTINLIKWVNKIL